MMLAFTNTKQTKAQAVAMMQEHRRLDHIIKGTYGRGEGATFQGCLVGCATRGDHAAFEPEFGIPWRVAWLADDIFEGLPGGDSKDFPVALFEAVPEGADLSRVFDGWCAWMLADPVDGLVAISSEPSVAAMGELFLRASRGDEPSVEEWQQPARAARDAWAARAARAAWDAWASRASRAAWDAWDARDAWASRAARDAWASRDAWAARASRAARAARAIKQRDKLLELIQLAPVANLPAQREGEKP